MIEELIRIYFNNAALQHSLIYYIKEDNRCKAIENLIRDEVLHGVADEDYNILRKYITFEGI